MEPGDKYLQAADGYKAFVTAPFAFASAMTAQIVMERILAKQRDLVPNSRQKSLSSGSVNYITATCPNSPRVLGDEFMFCHSFSVVRNSLQELSMKRWRKDTKEKRKEANHVHNARVHAAMSVAGVAAAVAAIGAATATSTNEDEQSKTSISVAYAAALVAAQCVEVAESTGAARDQLSLVMRSAVSLKTPGDIIKLTAAAATALLGAATSSAQVIKDAPSLAMFIPPEKGGNTIMNFTSGSVAEDSESECRNSDCLRKGCEFLKCTRKGDFHWRIVFAYRNRDSQFCHSFSALRNSLQELSMKRWLKDTKEKRKEANHVHNARVHTAMSVVVVAVVAAIAAAIATSTNEDEQSKTSM